MTMKPSRTPRSRALDEAERIRETIRSINFLLKPFRIAKKGLNKVKSFLSYFIPIRTRWMHAQKNYMKWSSEEMPPKYLNYIRDMGLRFADFVGTTGLCLDVGSGNGLYGGVSYDEAGYKYLHLCDGDHIVGLDPLPLEGPIPSWINDYVMGVCERLPFRGVFDKISIATSFDHLFDHAKSLSELAMNPDGELYIWTTCLKEATPDPHHPKRFTRKGMVKLLAQSPFKHMKTTIDDAGLGWETVFIKANLEGCR